MRKISIVLLIGIISIFALEILINFERIRIDGIVGELLGICLLNDTKYSKNYSDKKFNSIKIGMTKEQVIKILGEPLSKWNPYDNTMFEEKKSYVGFEYSNSPTSTNYRLRQINFDNDSVKEKIGYFWVD